MTFELIFEFFSFFFLKFDSFILFCQKIFLAGYLNTNNDLIDDEKIIYLGDWLNSDSNEIDQLFKPINVVTVPCLALNSNGTHQWPPRLFIHNHFSLVATSETIADGRIFEFRSIDKLLVYGSYCNNVYATKISTRLYVPKTCENVSCTHVHHNTGYLFYIFMGYQIIETNFNYISIDGKYFSNESIKQKIIMK